MTEKFEVELSEPMSVWLDELSQMTGKTRNQVLERVCRYSAFVMSEHSKAAIKENKKDYDITWILAGKALFYMLNSDFKNEPKQQQQYN